MNEHDCFRNMIIITRVGKGALRLLHEHKNKITVNWRNDVQANQLFHVKGKCRTAVELLLITNISYVLSSVYNNNL